ncbi:MAG: SDR family oxidoreductase [Bacteroidales bacterium]|nr:SDR family oxidoreductase [Bacteroidales bacterium]
MAPQFTIITGASNGIGKALAIAYAGEGHHLILGARNTSKLEETAALCRQKGAETSVFPLDLSSEESINWFSDSVKQLSDHLDRLIHVGGISQRSYAEETILEVDRRIMQVNYFGTVALTKALLPLLKAGKPARIGVTSSISGKFGFYQRSAYSASKFALHGFFESLRLEMEDQKISVTIACPGSISTEISNHALDARGNPHGKEDARLSSGFSPEKCARIMKTAIEKRKKEVYIGGKEIIMVHLKRFFPSLFYIIAKRNKPTS